MARSNDGRRVRVRHRRSLSPFSGRTGTIVKRDTKPVGPLDTWVLLDHPVMGARIFAFTRWELEHIDLAANRARPGGLYPLVHGPCTNGDGLLALSRPGVAERYYKGLESLSGPCRIDYPT
jgi:hypothetical protein